ncbi:MAG: myo-inosose-2 dehydratase [Candidatus Undinarchaeales archaeon]|nr:myo-inosose-2 dehydratase [Candidatus Undinarchaeales archaeon]
MTDRMRVRLGVSPIAWSNDDMHDLGGEIPLERCLGEASTAGYVGVELGHKFPRDPAVLMPLLVGHGLDLVSGWHSTFFTREKGHDRERANFKSHLSFLKSMGCSVIICAECNRTRHSTIDAAPREKGVPLFTDEEWARLATRLDEAGHVAANAGLRLVYHHHMGTGVESPEEIHRLMDTTDPDLVHLLGDTGHMLYGGGDPATLFSRYAERIGHVHLKDIRRDVLEEVKRNRLSFLASVRMGVFTVPGDGCIDYGPVIGSLDRSGYEGWLVVEAEQDPAIAEPLAYARKARGFIRNKAGI